MKGAPLVIALALLACHGAAQSRPAPNAFTEGVVEAGGVALHVLCMGHGSPTVVFDAGLGNTGAIWKDVQPAVSRVTKACVYDRAGLGESGPAPRPHTSRQMVDELHAVLEQANLPGPHVLVGHSLGGLNMRLYATHYGASGLIFLDATSEDQDSRFWSLLPPEAMVGFREMLRESDEGLDYDAFLASLAQVRAARRSLANVPLIVMTHGRPDPPPPGVSPEQAADLERAWSSLQSDQRRFSSNAIQIVVPNSGHFIQVDAPDVVVAAILRVVASSRTREPLEP